MDDFKVVNDSWTEGKRDSMWYRSSDHEPVRVVNYKGRTWLMYAFGEVSFNYKDERYYCLSECTDIKNDNELELAIDKGDLDLWSNNWYEIRPAGEEYRKFVDMGLYDIVCGDPTELDKEMLDVLIAGEIKWAEEE